MSDLREVLLTLSPAQFEAFASDLKLLRESGAESNTQAIVSSVAREANRLPTSSSTRSERKAA